MRVRVECYAGHRDSERPVRFLVENQPYFVSEVLDQWYGPERIIFFKVRADDGNVYILRPRQGTKRQNAVRCIYAFSVSTIRASDSVR